MSHKSRHGRRIRSNNSGNTQWFKDCARAANRRVRHNSRLILSIVLSGDVDANERLERHRRHTADWDAY